MESTRSRRMGTRRSRTNQIWVRRCKSKWIAYKDFLFDVGTAVHWFGFYRPSFEKEEGTFKDT